MSNNDRRRHDRRRRNGGPRNPKPAFRPAPIFTDVPDSLMRSLAAKVKNAIPKNFGFALLVFPVGVQPKGKIRYIGDCDRTGVLSMMESWIARQRGNEKESFSEAEADAEAQANAEHHMPHFEKMAEAFMIEFAAKSNTPDEPLPDMVKSMLHDALAHGFAEGIAQQMTNPIPGT